MSITINDLLPIFRDTFEDESINVEDASTAKDVPGWDSLNHIYLVVAIEKKYKIKFTTMEIQGWKCAGDIVIGVNSKLTGK
jgi:acyl carrier protein